MMKDFFEKLNWITILAVAVAVEMQIGSGSMSITHMFPAAWVPGIQEAMGDLGTIGALILAYGSHGREIPDMQIPKVPPVAKIGAAILLAIMIGSLWHDPASAQTARQFDPIGQIKKDIASKTIEGLQNQTNSSSDALQQFADFITGDISGAADLAISIPDTLDGNAQICFDAMASAGKVFKANPIPAAADVKQGLVTAFERLRLLAMTANRVCQMSSCTQIFADASGALAALAPVKMPIPNVHDICSLIPNVAVAKPTRTLDASAATIAASATQPAPVATPAPAKP